MNSSRQEYTGENLLDTSNYDQQQQMSKTFQKKARPQTAKPMLKSGNNTMKVETKKEELGLNNT